MGDETYTIKEIPGQTKTRPKSNSKAHRLILLDQA